MPNRGILKLVGSITICAAIGVMAVLSTSSPHGRVAKASTIENPVVTRQEVQRFLAAAGIEPEALTAAGVTSEQAATVVSQARAYLADHITDLKQAFKDAADAAVLAAKPPTGEQSAAQLAAAAAAAKAARDSALASFSTAALANLSETVAPTIANIRVNRAQGLPLKYLVKTRTAEEWASLRNALAAIRTAHDRSAETPQAAGTVVTNACEDPAVAAAGSAVESNLAAVKAAWTVALNG